MPCDKGVKQFQNRLKTVPSEIPTIRITDEMEERLGISTIYQSNEKILPRFQDKYDNRKCTQISEEK
jgi:hypothetical protein